MNINLDITPETALTLGGGVVIAAIVGLWMKKYLADWRFTSLLVLGVTEGLLLFILFATTGFKPGWERALAVGLVALVASSLETFGYETIANVLGKMGHGTRSEDAQLIHAKALLEGQGYTVKSHRMIL